MKAKTKAGKHPMGANFMLPRRSPPFLRQLIFGVKLSWILKVGISLLYNVTPTQDILFLLGAVLLMTGLIIKFRWITFGGTGLLIFTVYTYYNPTLNLLLVNAIGITFGMLIPGLSLYFLKKHE